MSLTILEAEVHRLIEETTGFARLVNSVHCLDAETHIAGSKVDAARQVTIIALQ